MCNIIHLERGIVFFIRLFLLHPFPSFTLVLYGLISRCHYHTVLKWTISLVNSLSSSVEYFSSCLVQYGSLSSMVIAPSRFWAAFSPDSPYWVLHLVIGSVSTILGPLFEIKACSNFWFIHKSQIQYSTMAFTNKLLTFCII